MKPKTLCLPFLIVAFLFASEMPSVQGMNLPNDLSSLAAQELNYLISGVATGINDILFERSTMSPFMITNRGRSEIADISQKTDVTDVDIATENLTEKNGSAKGDIPQELSTLLEKVLNWISFLNILKRIQSDTK
ncbi:uncharacterized protein LOC126758890 [Bactrocera neohumeralis]|uniref:uncharacterized protein LOC126758890 n=1 Tax=Bactrocera neohumeralis TaxID=98809 RepID=UPI002165AFD0|nr:uncharacterized protein LOC126758890 [Bactrocera neohumeralis]